MTLALYDTKNAELQTFAIALDGNGSGSAASTACTIKGACDTSTTDLDLEVLAAQVFPTLAGGYADPKVTNTSVSIPREVGR